MMHYKKISYTFLLFLGLYACTSSQPGDIIQKAEQISDSLKQVYAPDGRTELIDITIKQTGNSLTLKGETTHPDFASILEKNLNQEGINITDSLATLPDPDLQGKTRALVNVSVANLRGKPGHSQEQVTQVVMGTPLKVFKKKGGWYFVQTPEKYLAWVDQAAIVLLSETDWNTWKQQERVIFLGDFEIIRAKPSAASNAVSDLVFGGILINSGPSGSWIQVTLPDDRIGYLQKEQLKDFKTWAQSIQPSADAFEMMSMNLLGRPYLWGGTSVKGMDCSGFTKTLFLSGGLILDRDASQQINMGKPVDFSDLHKGDLLFWGRKASENQPERITHVGMYLGDDQYIHCSGRVKINSFNPDDPNYAEYLLKIFVRARRIIQEDRANYPFSIKNHPWY